MGVLLAAGIRSGLLAVVMASLSIRLRYRLAGYNPPISGPGLEAWTSGAAFQLLGD